MFLYRWDFCFFLLQEWKNKINNANLINGKRWWVIFSARFTRVKLVNEARWWLNGKVPAETFNPDSCVRFHSVKQTRRPEGGGCCTSHYHSELSTTRAGTPLLLLRHNTALNTAQVFIARWVFFFTPDLPIGVIYFHLYLFSKYTHTHTLTPLAYLTAFMEQFSITLWNRSPITHTHPLRGARKFPFKPIPRGGGGETFAVFYLFRPRLGHTRWEEMPLSLVSPSNTTRALPGAGVEYACIRWT